MVCFDSCFLLQYLLPRKEEIHLYSHISGANELRKKIYNTPMCDKYLRAKESLMSTPLQEIEKFSSLCDVNRYLRNYKGETRWTIKISMKSGTRLIKCEYSCLQKFKLIYCSKFCQLKFPQVMAWSKQNWADYIRTLANPNFS